MPIANPPAPAKSSTLRIEKPPYRGAQPLRVVKLAFPNRKHLPAGVDERTPVSLIACSISFQLWQPEIETRFRKPRERAAFGGVTVPKAAVHEYDFAPLPEHQVRPSG
jgi:hypothetical protein